MIIRVRDEAVQAQIDALQAKMDELDTEADDLMRLATKLRDQVFQMQKGMEALEDANPEHSEVVPDLEMLAAWTGNSTR